MSTPQALIAGLWGVFAVSWLVLARFTKRRRRVSPLGFWGLRLLLILGALALAQLPREAPRFARFLGYAPGTLSGPLEQWTGVGLCVAGFGCAYWARAHLGRNWGTPMSLREGHELVTAGPYRRVRHPIYTGILLAILGTGLAFGGPWIGMWLIALGFFVLAARSEERTLLAQFPSHYPEYRRRTWMLLPFVL